MLEPLTYRIDESLYFDFCALIFWKSIWRCLYWLVPVIVITVIFLNLSGYTDGGFLMPVIVGIIAGWVGLALQWLTLPSRAKKIYAESSSLQQIHTFSYDEVGFTIEQESGVWRSKWDDMAKWEETDKFFAIQPNRITANLLPKAQIEPAIIGEVRELLIASGLGKPGRLRK